jgi:Ankyrin repeats (3 copies)/Ankyrin repeats (many copies)
MGLTPVFLEEYEMLTRVWAVLLAACVVALMAGCKGGDEEKAGNGDGTGQTSTETPTPEANGGAVKPFVGTGTPSVAGTDGTGDANDTKGPTVTPKVDGTVEVPSTHEQLMTAVKKGDLEAVKTALATNPKWIDQEGQPHETPLAMAILSGQDDMALLLIEKQANPNLNGPLHLAASLGMNNVIEALINKRVDVDNTGPKDETPLHWATDAGKLAAVRILIDKGANIEARNEAGLRPLHKAVMYGDVKTVAWLLQQNASPNARANDGSTPLSLATAKGNELVIGALKAAGATIEGVPAESVPPPGE